MDSTNTILNKQPQTKTPLDGSVLMLKIISSILTINIIRLPFNDLIHNVIPFDSAIVMSLYSLARQKIKRELDQSSAMATLSHVFCTECGTENHFESTFCFKCGNGLQKKVGQGKPDRHHEIIDLSTPSPPAPIKKELRNVKTDTNPQSISNHNQLPNIHPSLPDDEVSTPFFLTHNHNKEQHNDTTSLPLPLLGANHPVVPLFPSLPSAYNSFEYPSIPSSLDNVNQSQSTVASSLSIASCSFVLGDNETQSVQNTTKRKPSDKEELDDTQPQINTEKATTSHDRPISLLSKKQRNKLKRITKSNMKIGKAWRWRKWEEDFIKKEWKKMANSKETNHKKCIIISHKLEAQTALVLKDAQEKDTPKPPWRTTSAVWNKLDNLGMISGSKRNKRKKKIAKKKKTTNDLESNDLFIPPSPKKRRLNKS
eukprot:1117722_1